MPGAELMMASLYYEAVEYRTETLQPEYNFAELALEHKITIFKEESLDCSKNLTHMQYVYCLMESATKLVVANDHLCYHPVIDPWMPLFNKYLGKFHLITAYVKWYTVNRFRKISEKDNIDFCCHIVDQAKFSFETTSQAIALTGTRVL